MEIGYTTAEIRLHRGLTNDQMNIFQKVLNQFHKHFFEGKSNVGFEVEGMFFPGDRPKTVCRWEMESDFRLIYNDVFYCNNLEDHYQMVDWLQYLVDNFFNPLDVLVSGHLNFFSVDESLYGEVGISRSKIKVVVYKKKENN